ncbi:MAG: M24 family metallopeptidase [Spirochaetia bacterium]
MNKRDYNQKIKELCTSAGCSALLVSNPLSLTYVTGLELPFAEHFPEKPVTAIFLQDGPSLMLCPYEWRKSVLDQGWKGELIDYRDSRADAESFSAKKAADFFRKQNTDSYTIGIEEEYISRAFFELLQKAFAESRAESKFQLKGVDEILHSHKMVKSREEIERLQTAAEQLDFGIIGALQHLEGSLEDTGYTAEEFCERIRVHVYECGGTAGSLSAVAANENLTQFYGLPRGKFRNGEMVRIEAGSRYLGGTAVSSRMMTIGKATRLQKRAYMENQKLKRVLLRQLKPGNKCSDIYYTIEKKAHMDGIDLLPQFGLGHGIGSSEKEAPFLTPYDTTVLKEGMVIVAAVYSEGPHKELICSKDTYLIDSHGPTCISNYHNWENLYEVTGFRSAH